MRTVVRLGLLTLILASGCSGLRPLPEGIVRTPGLRIQADDGSFELVSGKPFVPPFQSDWGSGAEEVMLREKNLGRAYVWALQHGARRVKVWREGERPLHGVLMFRPVHRDAVGPGSRLAEIRIPPAYFDWASRGRVVVLFGRYERPRGHFAHKNWVLWLSNRTLTGGNSR